MTEVAAYADAMDMVFESFESITITENHIKQLHGVLLNSKDQEHRGHYKKVPNHVEAFGPDGKSLGLVFETATPFETPSWAAGLSGHAANLRTLPLRSMMALTMAAEASPNALSVFNQPAPD